MVNRLWPVTDVSAIAAIAALIGPKPIFIADGHHRYETACNYRDHVYETGGLTPEHPANFVLMMCVAMEDPGLIVLPTHRLFRGLPAMTAGELAARLGDSFTMRPAGQGPETRRRRVGGHRSPAATRAPWASSPQKDQQWTLARLTDAGRARMADVAKDHTEPWRALGVSILHRLLIENLLGGAKLPKPKYVHLVEEVVAGLRTGEFPLAALVMPATVEDIRTISSSGERMPAKSTYFYPKLLSGLVINPLE